MRFDVVRALSAVVLIALGATAADVAVADPGGPIAGTKYRPAVEFVTKYCAECHTANGANPKKRWAYPCLELDTYEGWAGAAANTIRGALDKWHPLSKVMPPKGARHQPTDAERKMILAWIERGSPNTESGR